MMAFFHVVLVNSCSDVVGKIKMMSFFHGVSVNSRSDVSSLKLR